MPFPEASTVKFCNVHATNTVNEITKMYNIVHGHSTQSGKRNPITSSPLPYTKNQNATETAHQTTANTKRKTHIR
jgi:hypothetical protein